MTATEAMTTRRWVKRWWPESVVAALAVAMFLGFLGSVDLWGKREQRSSAEAIDTIDHGHWLVARIQGRPRLEKPPLPRWTIAGLMTLTGRRDEWVLRLPGALSALGMVGLVYGLGRRLGGRSVGIASALALTSTGFFVVELRQAGNDGPLAFFTTVALYAAWRRLHGDGDLVASSPQSAGARRWVYLFYGALGLGFLCKGPVVILIAAVTLVPYLACAGRLRSGLAMLADGGGAVLFLALAASWPVPVLLSDPNAAKVWLLEMGQKAGTSGIGHTRSRLPLLVDWTWMTLPWVAFATMGAILPLGRQGSSWRPKLWFPWWWSVGNLLMFCGWSVAKPNYFLPCLPGAALLAGVAWVRVTRVARTEGRHGAMARRILQAHWVILFAAALAGPVAVAQQSPAVFGWSLGIAAALGAGVVASAAAWRKGADGVVLAPLTAAMAAGLLIGYGALAPGQNGRHSHRALARTLDTLLPPDATRVMFFHELDEGLWFYIRGRELLPVPGSQPAYNDALKVAEDQRHHRLELDPVKRIEAQREILLGWLRASPHSSEYVLMRADRYDLFADALRGLVEPLYREEGLERNELVLLRVATPEGPAGSGAPVIAAPDREPATRRQ